MNVLVQRYILIYKEWFKGAWFLSDRIPIVWIYIIPLHKIPARRAHIHAIPMGTGHPPVRLSGRYQKARKVRGKILHNAE